MTRWWKWFDTHSERSTFKDYFRKIKVTVFLKLHLQLAVVWSESSVIIFFCPWLLPPSVTWPCNHARHFCWRSTAKKCYRTRLGHISLLLPLTFSSWFSVKITRNILPFQTNSILPPYSECTCEWVHGVLLVHVVVPPPQPVKERLSPITTLIPKHMLAATGISS